MSPKEQEMLREERTRNTHQERMPANTTTTKLEGDKKARNNTIGESRD